MHDMIERGKALYWGTSEWSAAEIMAAWQIADEHHLRKPVMEQPEYNLFHRKPRRARIRAPLRRDRPGAHDLEPARLGPLTGKYRAGVPADSRGAIPRMKFLLDDLTDKAKNDTVGKLEAVAKELGCTLAQLAIAWCAHNPNVSTVITGASRVSQVEENLRAAEFIPKLTPAVMERIDAIVAPRAD